VKIAELRVLVTGATGGIGMAICEELLLRGASVLMSGRDADKLAAAARRLETHGDRVAFERADLCVADDRLRLATRAATVFGGINALINNAGLGRFGLLATMSDDDVADLVAANVAAPLQLTRSLLPLLTRQREAAIVNVGSVFGAIGYPGQTVYSSTKFALRGFSEALRRELADTPIAVHYVAPRATRTRMNSDALLQLNAALGVRSDPPHRVAACVCDMLESGRRAAVIGWPEWLFVRINAVLPRLVDRSLARTLPLIRAHAPSTGSPEISS
jgi:short-subunit dehydrogenase